MKHTFSLFSLCILLIFSGCMPALPTPPSPPASYDVSSLRQEFESFWNGMNNNYVFWDIDSTDWDNVYRTYKPLFAELKTDDAGYRKAHSYYKDITAQLIDSHYTLTFKGEPNEFASLTPALSRLLRRPDFHKPIPEQHYSQTVFGTYLNPGARRGYDKDSSSIMVAGKIKNTNILYFHFPEFSLKKSYEEGTSSQKAILQYVFDELSNSNLAGLLLDLRGNDGGDVDDLNFLIGRLVDKPYVYGFIRAKAGMGRLDYLPWVKSLVYPNPSARSFTKPVIALVDMYSISMSEATAMAVKALPGANGKIVGERTFGAMAPLTNNSYFNGGSFATPFLADVKTASMMFRYKDMVSYESVGFPSDIEAKYDKQGLQAGKDTQLEKAISQIQ